MNPKILLMALSLILIPSKAFSQINADTSLGLDSSVVIKDQSINGRTFDIIVGGKKSGSFLIHSFDTFSIPKGKGALFSPNQDIKTVISRVTLKKSRLNGFLGIQGNQNLIFVNPNGIQFNSEFQSGISGSLFFSNASKLKFGEKEFLSTNSKNISLFNKPISTIDFVFEDSSNSEILIKNSPKTFFNDIFVGFVPIPIFLNDIPQGFTSFPGQKINLIANKIIFDGGIINSFGGKISLYSILDGVIKYDVNLNQKASIVNEYGDINLNNLSNIVDFSSNKSSISLLGKNIVFSNGSFLTSFSNNQFQTQKGTINISAEKISFSSFPDSSSLGLDGLLRSGVLSNAEAGIGSDINIFTTDATFDLAAGILSRANNNAIGGDVNIKAKNKISAFGQIDRRGAFSGIGSLAYLQAKGGNIKIESNSIELDDAASIQTYSFDQGTGGNINISADNKIEIRGINNISPIASQIQTYSFTSSPAGNVDVTAQKILIRDGGGIGSTAQKSDTGFVSINADSIDLSGSIPSTISRSRIFASVQEQEDLIAELFIDTGVLEPDDTLGSGNAKNLVVNTRLLRVSNDAEISVRNDGFGDGGNLQINAFRTELNDGAQITASTKSGDGGNIFLDSDLLLLQDSSVLSSAEGKGLGGSINIKSSVTALDSTSKIQANAENNKAGMIFINTNAFLAGAGTEVTTTSNLGPQFDGTIEAIIQNPKPSPPVRLATLKQVNLKLSQLCGYDGNSVSRQGTGFVDEIISDPKLLKGFDLKRRMELVNQFKIRDPETGEVKPFKRLLGVKDMGNGKGKWVFDLKDAPELQSLISFLEKKCEGYAQSAS